MLDSSGGVSSGMWVVREKNVNEAREMTNLWWQGSSISPVENQEGAVGSRTGEGDHWILLGRQRLHHLLPRTASRARQEAPNQQDSREKNDHEISSRSPLD
jgi:hypothetical protein